MLVLFAVHSTYYFIFFIFFTSMKKEGGGGGGGKRANSLSMSSQLRRLLECDHKDGQKPSQVVHNLGKTASLVLLSTAFPPLNDIICADFFSDRLPYCPGQWRQYEENSQASSFTGRQW